MLMLLGQIGQQRLARRRELNQYPPAVLRVWAAANKTPRNSAIDQFDSAVVLDLEPTRQVAHGRRLERRGNPLQCQQQLVLLRLDTGRVRGTFAEVKKAAQLEAKTRERNVVNDR